MMPTMNLDSSANALNAQSDLKASEFEELIYLAPISNGLIILHHCIQHH